MKTAIVVPTCRPEGFAKFQQVWGDSLTDDARWIVVEDGPDRTIPDAYAWPEIEFALGGKAWIISRRDSAIRSFGFLVAWRAGCDFVVTIDDDCLPNDISDLVAEHQEAMRIDRFVSTIHNQRVRGMPYGADAARGLSSMVNVGLWSKVLDFDAITQLSLPPTEYDIVKEEGPNGTVAPGQYLPMCGMNLAFRREAIPLMYFGLQGQGYPVGRFDDIWCGILAKRISDHLGWAWTYGNPIVEHSRASDPFRNLMKEAPGVAEHETYWRHLAETPLTERTAAACMLEASDHIGCYQPKYLQRDYFTTLSKAVRTWADLFS
jgi:hypothetical protein